MTEKRNRSRETIQNGESYSEWCLNEPIQPYQPLLWHHRFPWRTITGFRTFSNVVSQKSVVDFGTLSVLAHLKLREGDPPVRPSWGKGSSQCSRSPPSLRPCCYGLAEWPGTRHPGKPAGRKKTRHEGDGDAGRYQNGWRCEAGVKRIERLMR